MCMATRRWHLGCARGADGALWTAGRVHKVAREGLLQLLQRGGGLPPSCLCGFCFCFCVCFSPAAIKYMERL